MKIVMPPNNSPSTFGVGLDETTDELHIITPCCDSMVVETNDDDRYEIDGLDGAPRGPIRVVCNRCKFPYKGYANTSSPLRDDDRYLADHWVSPWLGFDRGEVTVDIERV